ncbi:ParB/RepB/Spo0J family partition protein [Haematobacter genomosp. 1]|uniref:Chromosome partitioning protein ParB n=1 Tax=Haematobacter genomosp. 1 TaxID=366618 RepID=A0A212ABD5_9RHOB|nr:ParB/RepB/Spo0J family partition protein [Haematobacter genomosp. 1]OWJ77946.1 chromosome partitioning protein ParB [Haematobacter genomosp. 1]
MARKQSDYLADLLGSNDPSPATERVRPSTLLSRESALARVQSGEVKQVTQLLLDPSRVRVWSGNARRYDRLTEENCADLIESLIAEGGQKVPAVVRHVSDDPAYDYEVIAGTRRHWSISWLRAHSYPEIQFLAQVAMLDDEAAFRLADIENRARRDISDLERARNYASALSSHYGGKQKRMAERLRVSEGWLSKMLRVAAIPDSILAAFSSVDDIQLKPAYSLAQALNGRDAFRAISAEALRIAKEQDDRRHARREALSSSDVLSRLMAAPREETSRARSRPLVFNSGLGRPALSVQSVSRQGITLRLHSGSGASREELAGALMEALDQLESGGFDLK